MSVKNNAIYAKLLHISAKASFGGIRIENVGLPTTPDDVATKAYVDSTQGVSIGGFCPMNLSLCNSLISNSGTYYVRSSCNIRNLQVTKMMIWTTQSTSTVRVALYEDSGSQLKLLSSGSVTSVSAGANTISLNQPSILVLGVTYVIALSTSANSIVYACTRSSYFLPYITCYDSKAATSFPSTLVLPTKTTKSCFAFMLL